jgi:hypothetical protein
MGWLEKGGGYIFIYFFIFLNSFVIWQFHEDFFLRKYFIKINYYLSLGMKNFQHKKLILKF